MGTLLCAGARCPVGCPGHCPRWQQSPGLVHTTDTCRHMQTVASELPTPPAPSPDIAPAQTDVDTTNREGRQRPRGQAGPPCPQVRTGPGPPPTQHSRGCQIALQRQEVFTWLFVQENITRSVPWTLVNEEKQGALGSAAQFSVSLLGPLVTVPLLHLYPGEQMASTRRGSSRQRWESLRIS